MRPFKLRITYSANGIRRIEFPGTNPNGKRLTITIPDSLHPRRSKNFLSTDLSPSGVIQTTETQQDFQTLPSLDQVPSRSRQRARLQVPPHRKIRSGWPRRYGG